MALLIFYLSLVRYSWTKRANFSAGSTMTPQEQRLIVIVRVLSVTVTIKNLPQDQAHVNLIYLIKALVCKLAVPVDFIYVPGHQDKDIPQHLLTQEQKVNVDMDTLTKWCLKRAIRNCHHFIDSTFPWEPFQFRIQGYKVLRSSIKAIKEAFSRQVIHLFYDTKKTSSHQKILN